MVLLHHLTGPLAGQETRVPRFPFQIGRTASCDLRLEAPGVWDQHAVLERSPERRFQLRVHPPASLRVNDAEVPQPVTLRQGDLLQLGDVRLQFWLAPVQQPDLRLREALTWTALVLLAVLQGFVAWHLTP